jgi:hypothetical protein
MAMGGLVGQFPQLPGSTKGMCFSDLLFYASGVSKELLKSHS